MREVTRTTVALYPTNVTVPVVTILIVVVFDFLLL